jgi:hypothetical protein
VIPEPIPPTIVGDVKDCIRQAALTYGVSESAIEIAFDRLAQENDVSNFKQIIPELGEKLVLIKAQRQQQEFPEPCPVAIALGSSPQRFEGVTRQEQHSKKIMREFLFQRFIERHGVP